MYSVSSYLSIPLIFIIINNSAYVIFYHNPLSLILFILQCTVYIHLTVHNSNIREYYKYTNDKTSISRLNRSDKIMSCLSIFLYVYTVQWPAHCFTFLHSCFAILLFGDSVPFNTVWLLWAYWLRSDFILYFCFELSKMSGLEPKNIY